MIPEATMAAVVTPVARSTALRRADARLPLSEDRHAATDPQPRGAADAQAPGARLVARIGLARGTVLVSAQEQGGGAAGGHAGAARAYGAAAGHTSDDGHAHGPMGAGKRLHEHATAPGLPDLSEAQMREVTRLKLEEAQVRRHEMAHAMAAGPHGAAPSYQYRRGPDGKMYIVGGRVKIDASVDPNADPRATIRKMRTILRAALAPADPSGQDRMVAAIARAAINKAMSELRAERMKEANGEDGPADPYDLEALRQKLTPTASTAEGGAALQHRNAAQAYGSPTERDKGSQLSLSA